MLGNGEREIMRNINEDIPYASWLTDAELENHLTKKFSRKICISSNIEKNTDFTDVLSYILDDNEIEIIRERMETNISRYLEPYRETAQQDHSHKHQKINLQNLIENLHKFKPVKAFGKEDALLIAINKKFVYYRPSNTLLIYMDERIPLNIEHKLKIFKVMVTGKDCAILAIPNANVSVGNNGLCRILDYLFAAKPEYSKVWNYLHKLAVITSNW